MRIPEMRPIHWYVAAVSLGGLGVVIASALTNEVANATYALSQFMLFAAFLVVGELVPVKIPRRDEDEEVTTSGTFAYAMVLSFGVPAAVLVHAVATLAADLVRRKPWWKATFNAGQYVFSVVAAGSVLALLSDVPRADPPPAFHSLDLPAILVGALVFLVVNHTLTRTAIALAQRLPVLPSILGDLSFHASTTFVMLALAPIVVVAAERSLWLVPLLALPMVGAYRTTSIWLDKQYKEHQAMHDALTGLPNRRLFQDRIRQALLGGRRGNLLVGVLIIDLDRFKDINDTLGHHIGDLLLQMIGPRLQALLRESDTIARLGGDEFAVLLPKVDDAAGGVRVADKILKALEEPFVVEGLALDIDASIGIALYPEHGQDVNILMQRADIAMYVAKEAHTGYEMYAVERDRHSAKRLTLLGELRKAIDDGQFVLHYQPIAEMKTGRIGGVEALVRWQHPRHGLMMPDEFIPLAEHTGLIKPLTMYVLHQALRQCRTWHQAGLKLSVAVNLSVRNLQDEEFPEQVGRLLREHEMEPSWLELEITESAIVVDPIRALGVLGRLGTMGVGLSLDDFGTGYSSLAYLRRLPVTEIKIDKSFILNMSVDENDAVIVRSTIELARNLGLQVVAEGVESEEMWRRLASLGCDHAQGDYLSAPVPAEDLTSWLAAAGRIRQVTLPGLDPETQTAR
jgi:diguanylate cyclase (GGDEF)-like protein